MLTFPSDPLPQIVCPMDEDAIPPSRFCSAPPHNEPPPPLLPLSSVTPSCVNDGISEHRRSGRIQDIRAPSPKKHNDSDSRAAQRPSRQNPSCAKRQRDDNNMVQVSQSKQPRVESTQGCEKQNEDGFDFNFAAEHQDEKEDETSPQKKTDVAAAAENVTEFTPQKLDATKPDGNTSTELALENSSASKRWVIGPFFQSFKTKMASFSEIVMCPVKLFTGNSPVPSIRSPDRAEEGEPQPNATPEPSQVFHPEAQGEDGNLEAQAKKQMLHNVRNQNTAKRVPVKYVKKLSFDVELERTDECAIAQTDESKPDSVPSQHCHLPSVVPEEVSESIGYESASRETTLSSCVEPKGKADVAQPKPLPRKCTGGRKKSVTSKSRSVTSDLGKETCSVVVKRVSDEQVNSVTLSRSDIWSEASSVCSKGCDQDGRMRMNSSDLVRQSLRNHVKDGVPGRTLKPALDTRQLELQPSVENDFPRREKRELAVVDCPPQDSVKRKKLTADKCQKAKQSKDLVNVTSKRSKPQKKGVIVSVETSVHMEQTVKPTRKRASAPKKLKEKAQEVLAVSTEAVLKTQTECSDVICDVLENKQKGSNKAVKAKRPKTQNGLDKAQVTTDETTVLLQPAAQSKQKLVLEVLLRPDIKQTRKKPQKRKVPQGESLAAGLDQTVVSSSAPAEPESEQPVVEVGGGRLGPNQAPKRPKKASRGTVRGTKQTLLNFPVITKEKESGGDNSSAGTSWDSSSFSDCSVKQDMKQLMHVPASVAGEAIPCEAVPRQNSSVKTSRESSRARWVNVKPRRKSRTLHGRTRKGDELTTSVTMEDADADASENSPSRRLLRSYSCPEIPSLQPLDTPWTCSSHPSPPHSRAHASPQHPSSHAPSVLNGHKSPRRARRHTVCSVEVEREIAPLCLRKEVYPSRRSFPYDQATAQALTPSPSLSVLASCFLSSPLAFLSKRVDCRVSAAALSSPSHISSPSNSSPSSSPWRLPGFLQRADATSTSMDSGNSVIPLECEMERRRQSEEDDDGEDTSSSSQEFEDTGMREEKALSDSELKVVQKSEERGKVSSIRIRKALPKPQNNLTPMGLPKPVRLKKKEFSLEEIYTNKNFSKSPESRLETIFEVPLNRRNGSESLFGQRRLKRFLEFLELGEVRKPKKPLVGVGKTGNSSSRPRRRGFSKDEASLSVQDVESLLCQKLEQLDLWLVQDQTDSGPVPPEPLSLGSH